MVHRLSAIWQNTNFRAEIPVVRSIKRQAGSRASNSVRRVCRSRRGFSAPREACAEERGLQPRRLQIIPPPQRIIAKRTFLPFITRSTNAYPPPIEIRGCGAVKAKIIDLNQRLSCRAVTGPQPKAAISCRFLPHFRSIRRQICRKCTPIRAHKGDCGPAQS